MRLQLKHHELSLVIRSLAHVAKTYPNFHYSLRHIVEKQTAPLNPQALLDFDYYTDPTSGNYFEPVYTPQERRIKVSTNGD